MCAYFLHLVLWVAFLQSLSAFDCVRDVPTSDFLFQENSFIEYYDVDSSTTLEVQVFNADKLVTSKTPLLFIHGYTDSRWSFLSTVQCLNIGDRAIIVPSLRGFGDSQIYSADDSTFSIQQFASDLVVILDTLNVEKAVWIGHSMGSWVAHYAAGANSIKSRVESIMLLATGAALDSGLCDAIDVYINESCPDRGFIDAFQEKDVIAGNISAAYANQVLRESYKVALEPLQQAWYELCAFDLAPSYVSTIAVNTTLIWGSLDGVTPIDQNFVDAFTGTTPNVHIVPDVGHNLQWFAPSEIAEIIKTHVGFDGESEEDAESFAENYRTPKYVVVMAWAMALLFLFL